MKITKVMLEERLKDWKRANTVLTQDNEALKRELSFITKFVSNPSMIIAMEKMTEALAQTIDNLNKRGRR